MESTYSHLKAKREWSAAIGMSEKQFHNLGDHFEQEYLNLFGKTKEENLKDSPQTCTIKTEKDLLFLLLFSLKTGLTEDALGFVFKVGHTTISRNKQIALRVLTSTLVKLGVMPKRSFETIGEFKEYFKDHPQIMIDGTEIRIQRPENEEEQKDCYSGKKNATR
jgi:hypothetical protein